MSTPKLVMFTAFMFIVGLIISYVMAGAWFTSTNAAVMNSLTVIRTYNIGGLFTIPWLNADFFLVGIPRLFMWDVGFFGGQAQIIQWFFYVITIGFLWGVLPVVVGILSKVF